MDIQFLKQEICDHYELVKKVEETLIDDINKVGLACSKTLLEGNKIMLCGNGGSASDAQHIAAEIVGRYVKERKSLPAISLSTDTSALTAIGNDYGYENIFSRQIEGLGNKGDLLIAISTSGKSENILRAIDKALSIGITVVGFSGRDGGDMKDICDYNIVIPSNTTARIQEMHIMVGHLVCQIVDNNY